MWSLGLNLGSSVTCKSSVLLAVLSLDLVLFEYLHSFNMLLLIGQRLIFSTNLFDQNLCSVK